MAGIAALPLNGRKALSLFAGGGGSSTGYRMAGYRVIWANEFIPRMQETYRANHPDTILDGRSIRDIDPGAVLKMLNLQPGDLDLLDGSPPCQSFSMAGQRERGWAKVRDYGHGIKQRNDDLFAEYIRFVKKMQPKVFIAENVSGLVKGTAKGTFKEILRSLKECGYIVEAELLDAQWLGVPQMRQRIIFCGVRADLGLLPVFPKPLPYRYSVRDALMLVDGCVYRDHRGAFGNGGEISDKSSPPVLAESVGTHWIVEHDESGQRSQGEITDLVSPTVRANRAATHFIVSARVGGQFQPPDVETARPCNTIGANGEMQRFEVQGTKERRKLTIAELKRICSFPDDYILTGSYGEQWTVCGNAVPPVMMFHMAAAVRDGIFSPLSLR